MENLSISGLNPYEREKFTHSKYRTLNLLSDIRESKGELIDLCNLSIREIDRILKMDILSKETFKYSDGKRDITSILNYLLNKNEFGLKNKFPEYALKKSLSGKLYGGLDNFKPVESKDYNDRQRRKVKLLKKLISEIIEESTHLINKINQYHKYRNHYIEFSRRKSALRVLSEKLPEFALNAFYSPNTEIGRRKINNLYYENIN